MITPIIPLNHLLSSGKKQITQISATKHDGFAKYFGEKRSLEKSV